ncbi:hypothetical protein AB0J90_26025 [Micromonospora sp. NPDC049523]|uniref:hypothetical protein n=1 Tax=Micromonospora sp. NPDC049523 TaxID=3155921 RepID=UPI003434E2E0
MDNQTESTRHGFEELLGEVLRDAGPAADALRTHLPQVAGAVYTALLTERIEHLGAAGNSDEAAERADRWRRIHELGTRVWQLTEPDTPGRTSPTSRSGPEVREPDAVDAVAPTASVQPGTATATVTSGTTDGSESAQAPTPDRPTGESSAGTEVRTEMRAEQVTSRHDPHDQAPGARPDVVPAQVAEQVERILAKFVADDRVRGWLGDTPAPGETLAARWHSFHLGLLRLPASSARQWAGDAAQAVPAEWRSADGEWTMLPDDLHRRIIPRLGGAPGVCLDPRGAHSQGALAASNSVFEEHFSVTSYATQIEWLVANDRFALHVRETKLEPLREEEEQERYRKRLHDAIQSYAGQPNLSTGGGDPAQRLIRAAGLAEVLRSVVHQPLVAPDSWWGTFRSRASALVDATVAQLGRQWAQQLERQVDQPFDQQFERQFDQRLDRRPDRRLLPKFEALHLKGRYADLIQQRTTDQTLDVRLPAQPGVKPGEVLDCLRPRLVLGDSGTRPGVVMYVGDA